MAATNFQVELAAAIPVSGQPVGAIIRLVNKPAVYPSLGFSIPTGEGDTYTSSGTPSTPALGLGSHSIVSGVIDATYDGDGFIWTAAAPCQVISIMFQQSVIEATGNSTTIDVKKVPSGAASIAAGTTLLSAAINLKTGVVANTVLSAPLTATAASLVLAATDSLALDFTNAITEYIGCITVNVNFI